MISGVERSKDLSSLLWYKTLVWRNKEQIIYEEESVPEQAILVLTNTERISELSQSPGSPTRRQHIYSSGSDGLSEQFSICYKGRGQ